MTDRQREVLAYIVSEHARGESLPTMRELCARFGWASTNAAHDHVIALGRRGALRVRHNGKSRSYGLNLEHRAVAALLAACTSIAATGVA